MTSKSRGIVSLKQQALNGALPPNAPLKLFKRPVDQVTRSRISPQRLNTSTAAWQLWTLTSVTVQSKCRLPNHQLPCACVVQSCCISTATALLPTSPSHLFSSRFLVSVGRFHSSATLSCNSLSSDFSLLGSILPAVQTVSPPCDVTPVSFLHGTAF